MFDFIKTANMQPIRFSAWHKSTLPGGASANGFCR